MKLNLRNPFCLLALVAVWRIALFIFTAQPIPVNDAAFFDGAMGNWFLHGHYFNPGLSVVFPISGHQLYSAYPPLYQVALWFWMGLFGTSVLSMIALHACMFCIAGFLVVYIVETVFPETVNYALVPLLLFAVTFDDRPEGLAHIFGLLALLLVTRSWSSARNWLVVFGIGSLLFCALYTSVIVGALYFGAGFIAVALAWWRRRNLFFFVPFIFATFLFVMITVAIARFEPLWWAGFRENARQTPVMTTGFRIPNSMELIKLVRTAPVFLLMLMMLPILFVKRKLVFDFGQPWFVLVGGAFIMGWVLLLADMTLLAANYVGYVLFLQVLLAAGILAATQPFSDAFRRHVRCVLWGCIILVSIRAVGMSTWGAACAWKNSYPKTHAVLLSELAPFAKTNLPALVSSSYFYTALEAGVQNPIHSDWYFDRANWTNNAQINGLAALRPAKLVLNQFDYYRAFKPLLEQLRQQPGLVDIRVRDLAEVRTPDSIPSVDHVVQNISWAPVIVDLDWKQALK